VLSLTFHKTIRTSAHLAWTFLPFISILVLFSIVEARCSFRWSEGRGEGRSRWAFLAFAATSMFVRLCQCDGAFSPTFTLDFDGYFPLVWFGVFGVGTDEVIAILLPFFVYFFDISISIATGFRFHSRWLGCWCSWCNGRNGHTFTTLTIISISFNALEALCTLFAFNRLA